MHAIKISENRGHAFGEVDIYGNLKRGKERGR